MEIWRKVPGPSGADLTPADQDAARPLLQLLYLDGGVGGDGAVVGHSVPEETQQGVVQLGRDARHVHQRRDLRQTETEAENHRFQLTTKAVKL